MAGDWFKMRTDLDETPEVIGMAARLGVDEDKVIALCYRLWRWADRQCLIDNETLDAHANGLPLEWIDRHVRFDGFADALRAFDWLKAKKGGFILPHAGRWLGENAKARATASQKKRIQRKPPVPQSVPDNKGQNQGPEERREEKRREGGSTPLNPRPASRARKSATPRKRDELFEALAEACGLRVSSLTDTERGRLNAACKELRKVQASPADVLARAKHYREAWPNAAITPQAITGNWSKLDGSMTPRLAADNDPYAWVPVQPGDPRWFPEVEEGSAA